MPSRSITLPRPSRAACTAALTLASLCVSAAPSGPLSCDGRLGVGGCQPYAQGIFYGAGVAGPSSVFEYDEPVLDLLALRRRRQLRAVVDLPQALVRTYAQRSEDGNPSTSNGVSANAVGVDIFTLRRLGAPSPDFFTFSVVFTADGIGGIDNDSYSVGSYLGLRVDTVDGLPLGVSGGRFDDVRVLQAGNQVPVLPAVRRPA